MGDGKDWFAELDAELQKQTEAISKDLAEMNNQKRAINKTLIEDFWKIFMRFGKINVNMTMEPSHEAFAVFEVYPDVWHFKEGFNFAAVNSLQLVDRTTEQGRMGDSLKVWYYSVDSTPHVRMIFEYCEGEHYYKYAGWKRIFAQFVVYDAAMAKADLNKMHEKMSDVVKVWYESHLRRNRDVIIKHLKENFERGETFTE
jgi:hypothetical protein